MHTYGTIPNTQNDTERFLALHPQRETPTEDRITREKIGFDAFAPLELWDCEHNCLPAGETRLFRVRFRKGQSIRLRAWAKEGIGISIQDLQGRMIAQDVREDGHPSCAMVPQRSGEYLVTLANTAAREAHYVLYIADETLVAA